MKKLLLICFTLGLLQVKAQTYNPEKINKKAVKIYEQAIEYLRDGSFEEAIPILQKAIAIDSNYLDAILSLAGVYGELKKYQLSIDTYNLAQRKDSIYFKPYYLSYSLNHAAMGLFEDALVDIEKFLAIPKLNANAAKAGNYRKRNYEFAIAYAKKYNINNYEFLPINLGDSINTEKDEYYATVTVDDSLLIFNRKGEGIRENFMQSKIDKGVFRKAEMINGDINIEPSKGAITMSGDGEWIIFSGNFGRDKGFGDFDLFISYYTPQGWSEPENLGRNINTEFWESSPSLSADKSELFFSSNRYGGYGGKDLYVSFRGANGKFGPAMNLGKNVNTAGNEHSPFMHADHETFFFTSDGWQGYGGSDLFVMKRVDDSTWTEPINLGYPINTTEDEGYLAVSSDGKTAYYSSNRGDSKGGLDIYKFTLRNDLRPSQSLYVKGKVFDKKTGKSLPCKIELINNSNGTVISNIQTDEKGEYFITLPTNKDYTFTVNRKGYLFYSEVFELKTKLADSVYKKDIALEPVEINNSIVLKHIQFESNAATLLPSSKIELEKLLQLLTDNPTIKVEISGHTDNTGKEPENLKLSNARAKAVVDFLIGKNIAASRLTYKGYGSSKPIADNKTEQGKALNRRTECKIIGL